MSGFSLIGFISPESAAKLEARSLVLGADKKAICVAFLDMVAVLTEPPSISFFASAKQKLTLELAHFQTSLEILVQLGPVVPAVFGTKFNALTDAFGFLAGNIEKLRALMLEFGMMRQFQIDISWDAKLALTAFSREPVFAESIANTKKSGAAALGKLIQSGMELYRGQIAKRAKLMLRDAASEIIDLPIVSTEMVASFVVLIQHDKEAALDAAVEAVDALMPGLFKISFRGPLPACSFASVGFHSVEKPEFTKAATLLGVEHDASRAEITDAFRAFMKVNHPDIGGDAALAEAGKEARDLLMSVAVFKDALGPKLGSAQKKNLILTLRRDGDILKAA